MGRINDNFGVFLLIFAATNLTLLTFQSISLVISAVRCCPLAKQLPLLQD